MNDQNLKETVEDQKMKVLFIDRDGTLNIEPEDEQEIALLSLSFTREHYTIFLKLPTS